MSSTSDEKKLHQQIKTLSDAFLLPSTVPLDYKSVLRTATKHFKAFTEADASVLMLNDNNENLTPVYSIGIPFSRVKDSNLPLSTRLKDIISRPVFDVRYASFMNTPLIHNRKLIGLSVVFSIVPEKFHTFEQDKYKNLLLTILASYFAVSIENVTLTNSAKSMERPEFDWEHTFDSINDLISIHDADFNIIRANMAVARKFNMNIKDIVGKKCYKIFHGTDEPWKPCPHRKTMETMTSCTEEIDDPHMGGIFNITTLPRFNEKGKCAGTIHIARDVTEQRKRWNQAMQADKMSTLSMLITELAPEITNPLSLIAGYTQTLLKDATEKNRHELTEIQEHANRAASFLKQLLNFAEQDNFLKKDIDIHPVIEKAISLFSHKLEEQNIRLIREYDKPPLLANCNGNQMELVFVNLISNALDAIESRGNIERVLSVKTERKDKSIQIHLKHTSCGIPEDNTKRIFDPFFTTKEAEKGTDLGLSICQKIIHEHGGNIQAFSQLGKGTTFTIELPLIETMDEKSPQVGAVS